jgi:hypothetical protein
LPPGAPDRIFRDEVRELLSLHSIRLPSGTGPLITDTMSTIRRSGLPQRMECYMHYRIDAQCTWYASKAHESDRSARLWRILLLILEALGVTGSLLILLDYSFLDFSGILAALIIAGMAWVEVRQFSSLAEAYALTSQELLLIRDSVSEVSSEDSWSRYVNSAENGISREHTMWLAKRTGLHNGR